MTDTDGEYHDELQGRRGGGGTPIVIGSLRKGCYRDFVSYVRGAVAKIVADSSSSSSSSTTASTSISSFDITSAISTPHPATTRAAHFQAQLNGLTDADVAAYDARFGHRKKEVSIVWALMAYSAGLVEALMVVDRWMWLREQEEVEKAWVESVWEYAESPRNLVVVGVKRRER